METINPFKIQLKRSHHLSKLCMYCLVSLLQTTASLSFYDPKQGIAHFNALNLLEKVDISRIFAKLYRTEQYFIAFIFKFVTG